MDYHHTVEDIGIATGACLSGRLWVIKRVFISYGSMLLPMDEALDALTAVDIGGRSSVNFDVADTCSESWRF